MTMDERIEAAARLLDYIATAEEIKKGGADLSNSVAKLMLAAAFPELSGDKPTHWLAPWNCTQAMDSAGYLDGDNQDPAGAWPEMRDAYLGKGDGE